MRFCTLASKDAGHLNGPVCRDIVDVPVMGNVHIVLGLLVIVNGVNHFTRRIRIVCPAALLQLFRFDVQVRIFIQIKQLLLYFLHNLSACATFVVFAHFNGQHLFLLEVVKQIRARQQIQGADQPFAERQIEDVFHRGRSQATRGDAVEQFRKARLPVHNHIFDKDHVIQAEQVNGQIIVLGQFQYIADEHLHANRNIADADKAFETGMAIDCLGDHPGRVGKVNHPGVRADLLHVFNDVKNDRNSTQAFKQATCPVGFLAQITVAQRNALVQLTRLQLADAQLRGHEVSIFQCQATIQRFMHG